MSLAKNVHRILNGTMTSLSTVLPLPVKAMSPALVRGSYEQKEISVLIGLVGDVSGKIIIDTKVNKIDEIGQAMFGMAIEGEMLKSFGGELGNMIAGNLCTILEKEGIQLDISTPTVVLGETSITGFSQAFKLPVAFEDKTEMQLLLTIDEKN